VGMLLLVSSRLGPDASPIGCWVFIREYSRDVKERLYYTQSSNPLLMKSHIREFVPARQHQGKMELTEVASVRTSVSPLDPPLKRICNKSNVARGPLECHKTARHIICK
jgi:hypothetical protein